jgi:hypothetical protein
MKIFGIIKFLYVLFLLGVYFSFILICGGIGFVFVLFKNTPKSKKYS